MAGKGLYNNINAKRKRGERMRKKGEKGAPSESDFAAAKKTAVKMSEGGDVTLTEKQQKIAGAAPPTNKITGADFEAMRKGEKKFKDGGFVMGSCPHRPDGIRGVGAATKGFGFKGVK